MHLVNTPEEILAIAKERLEEAGIFLLARVCAHVPWPTESN